MQALYQKSTARTSIAGTVESISHITAETLYDCHKAFYTPSNMILTVVGDVDPIHVADLANRVLPKLSSPVIERDYGEEPYAWQIAGKIVETRETAPILTTLQLADIVASAMPPAERRKNKNPSRRTFQALRIAVNHELDALEEGLDTIFDHLAPGGRLCVITFHSLEDRIVKTDLAEFAKGCTCPPDFPVCVCGKTPDVKLTPRKPILPSEREVEENPRARSAKLRVAEKLKDPTQSFCEIGREME